MTRWRVVRAPESRYQGGTRYAVLSDREPGPRMGSRGGLHGWTETDHPSWMRFETACDIAAMLNGKPSTANMDRSAS